MAALVGAIARAIFALLGESLQFIDDPNIDLLQFDSPNDIKTKTTMNNTCVVWLEAWPGQANPDVISMSTYVKCGDDMTLTGTWLNPGINDVLTFTDARVDTITISFYDNPSAISQFPFPGVTLIANEMWHEKGWGDSVPFSNCIEMSNDDTLIGNDCKGDLASATVCKDFFADGFEGVLNYENYVAHGWAYYMALPQVGKDPWCNGGAKIIISRDEELEANAPVLRGKRALSRFDILDVD